VAELVKCTQKMLPLHEMTSLACVYDINEEFANKVASDLGVSAVTNDSEIFSNDGDRCNSYCLSNRHSY
jgi:hypothetical protein